MKSFLPTWLFIQGVLSSDVSADPINKTNDTELRAGTSDWKPVTLSISTMDYGNGYQVEVVIGNGQKALLDVDLVYPDTWVTTSCSSLGVGCVPVKIDETFQYVSVWSTTISPDGVYYNTNVQILDWRGQFEIGVVQTSSSNGRLGLGLDSRNSNLCQLVGIPPSKRQYGLYLPLADGAPGEITIGGFNANRFTGPITYLPMVGNGWEFSLGNSIVSISGKTYSLLELNSNLNGILDLSTKWIRLPALLTKLINDAIGAVWEDTFYTISCSFGPNQPYVILRINGGQIIIPPQVYITRVGDTGKCASAFQPLAQTERRMVFGSLFFKSVYTIYNLEGVPSIGIAQSSHGYWGGPPLLNAATRPKTSIYPWISVLFIYLII